MSYLQKESREKEKETLDCQIQPKSMIIRVTSRYIVIFIIFV